MIGLMYSTKMLLEVEVSTQFGPESAVNCVKSALNFSAIDKVRLIKVSSDYVPLTNEDANKKVFENVPRIL